MIDCTVIFIAMGVASLMTLCSVFLGAWIVSRGSGGTGKGMFDTGSEESEESGAFTIETPEEMALFPDPDEPDEAETHVLEKTAKFLTQLGGK